MRRIAIPPRPDWRNKAEAIGFVYHSSSGVPYWDESAAYSFSLSDIELAIEPAVEACHGMCLELVAEVVASDRLMARLAIPADQRDFVAASWHAGAPSLYGRFDFAYDGSASPKLYEYNADTPTAVFEAATFQWLWLEEMIATGQLSSDADQFNQLFDRLRDRFATTFPSGGFVHFAGDVAAVEDRQTLRFFEDLAAQVGIEPKFVAMHDIGLNADGRFVDAEGFEMQAAFKLYPWELMFREPYAASLGSAGVRWLEPPWKSILSNKGILPLLWERHAGHPNLLEAYFDDDPAAAALGDDFVKKPLFSREGANVTVVRSGQPSEPLDQGYGAEGHIRQAFHPPPVFGGRRPVVGAWMVGDEPAGIGIREDDGIVTRDTARFVPHFIDPTRDDPAGIAETG